MRRPIFNAIRSSTSLLTPVAPVVTAYHADSEDPELDAAIREEVNASRHTIARIKPFELKKIMRLYCVPEHEILSCYSHRDLVQLAVTRGIVDVPDQWTLDKLKQEQEDERERIERVKTNLSIISPSD